MSQRVIENLNLALHEAMAADERVFFLGEDVLDPYGGAFKAARGLSTRFPDRVISTPISELGIAGVANGLALAGQRPIVEFMFGDFIFLAFDQIVNFAAKSVTMYGERMPFHLLIRCPVGGHRSYGATHSQSVQKHFLGVPNLDLFEISPLHDNRKLLPQIIESGRPSILFESKILYAQPQIAGTSIDELFSVDFVDAGSTIAQVCIDTDAQATIISTGGMFTACLEAARRLFFEEEIEVKIIVPYQLYPFPAKSLGATLAGSRAIYVVEESSAGGTWGAEVSATLARELPELQIPVRLIHSADSIIPSARHLEREVLVGPDDIFHRLSRDLAHARH